MPAAEITIMTEGLAFPEGPVAMADGSVLVTEIARGAITRCDPAGGKTVIAQPGGGPTGAALGPDGALYVCNNGGFTWVTLPDGGMRPRGAAADATPARIERIDLQTGGVRVLYTASDKAALRGPNDLTFDAFGGFYVTDFGSIGPRSIERGAVCYGAIDGSSLREVIQPMLTPNGIALSADGRTLYVSESMPCRLWSFAVAGPGQLDLKPALLAPNGGTFLAGPGGYQNFDSLAVDSGGNICVATIFNGGITVIAPDGESLRHLPMPDPFTTNLCFGGADSRTAFVTLSESGRLARLAWPRPGLKLAYEG